MLVKLLKNTQETHLSEDKKAVSACHNLLDLFETKKEQEIRQRSFILALFYS